LPGGSVSVEISRGLSFGMVGGGSLSDA